MSVVNGTEKWAVLFLQTMIWNRHWPDGFPKQSVKPLTDPSVELSIQRSTINAVAGLYTGEVIPFSGKDHIKVGDVTLKLDASRNVYVMNMQGGKLVYRFLRENSFHIKSATFELAPAIGPKKDQLMLAIAARCVYLDVVDCPGEIDRFVAHAITEGLGSNNNGIIASVDLSKALAQPISLRVSSNSVGVPRVKQATVFVRGDAIVAQATFDTVKQASVQSKLPIVSNR
jgi:hypothetical protein